MLPLREMYHYSGCKNTFLVMFDDGLFPAEDKELISSLCKEVDGLLLIRPSKIAHVRMVYINKDGSRASMCGNGLRCVAHCAQRNLFQNQESLLIETDVGLHRATIQEDLVEVEMGKAPLPVHLSIPLESGSLSLSFLNTGVPHAVIETDDIDSIDVLSLGKKIRNNPAFLPEGTNVTFTSLFKNELADVRTRTYERGVEGETLACGTGAVAAALVLWNAFPQKTSLCVRCQSGEILSVRKEGAKVFLKGAVSCL